MGGNENGLCSDKRGDDRLCPGESDGDRLCPGESDGDRLYLEREVEIGYARERGKMNHVQIHKVH